MIYGSLQCIAALMPLLMLAEASDSYASAALPSDLGKKHETLSLKRDHLVKIIYFNVNKGKLTQPAEAVEVGYKQVSFSKHKGKRTYYKIHFNATLESQTDDQSESNSASIEAMDKTRRANPLTGQNYLTIQFLAGGLRAPKIVNNIPGKWKKEYKSCTHQTLYEVTVAGEKTRLTQKKDTQDYIITYNTIIDVKLGDDEELVAAEKANKELKPLTADQHAAKEAEAIELNKANLEELNTPNYHPKTVYVWYCEFKDAIPEEKEVKGVNGLRKATRSICEELWTDYRPRVPARKDHVEEPFMYTKKRPQKARKDHVEEPFVYTKVAPKVQPKQRVRRARFKKNAFFRDLKKHNSFLVSGAPLNIVKLRKQKIYNMGDSAVQKKMVEKNKLAMARIEKAQRLAKA